MLGGDEAWKNVAKTDGECLFLSLALPPSFLAFPSLLLQLAFVKRILLTD